MAYLEPLDQTCRRKPCREKATHLVVSAENTTLGLYCRQCSQIRLKIRQRYEDTRKKKETR